MPRFTHAEFLAYQAREAARKHSVQPVDGVEHEHDLHDQILAECKRRGWIALHSRMDAETGRNEGEWDFSIRADRGRVIELECKTASGKLTTKQLGMIQWAARLGHTVHVVRSFRAFLEILP